MLKDVAQREKDSPIAAVGGPLLGEAVVVDAGFRDAEVPCIGQVEPIEAELQLLALGDARVLGDAEVDVADPVAPESVAPEV